jgi:hypothetical protein
MTKDDINNKLDNNNMRSFSGPVSTLETDFFGMDGNQIYSRYFRQGLFTQLFLYPIKQLENGGKEVKWKYFFVDLGLRFEIERHFIVWGDETVLDVQTGCLSKAENVEDLREKLYDHYRSYLQAVYEKLGVNAIPIGTMSLM